MQAVHGTQKLPKTFFEGIDMNRRSVLSFVAFAGLALASTKSYTVSLFFPVKLGTTELKAGDYKLEVADNKVVLRNGKTRSEATVTVEEAETRFDKTSVRVVGEAGDRRIQEIRLGGTRTKLVVNE
jgi:hypothetical protein